MSQAFLATALFENIKENLRADVKMRADILYVTPRIPISFVHGFVEPRGRDQNPVVQRGTEYGFVCLILALWGNADRF